MAEKKKAKTEKVADASKDALVSVAETIGHAVGNLARKAGLSAPKAKKGKLPPKNKKRLPRREKKAAQKKTASRV